MAETGRNHFRGLSCEDGWESAMEHVGMVGLFMVLSFLRLVVCKAIGTGWFITLEDNMTMGHNDFLFHGVKPHVWITRRPYGKSAVGSP